MKNHNYILLVETALLVEKEKNRLEQQPVLKLLPPLVEQKRLTIAHLLTVKYNPSYPSGDFNIKWKCVIKLKPLNSSSSISFCIVVNIDAY